jgi:hypothetical protein
MSGAIPPLPQYAFLAWCLVKKHRDNFTFTFTRCQNPEDRDVYALFNFTGYITPNDSMIMNEEL